MAAFPRLSEKGAYSTEEVYTKDDVQRIVQYANEVRLRFNAIKFALGTEIPYSEAST